MAQATLTKATPIQHATAQLSGLKMEKTMAMKKMVMVVVMVVVMV